MPCTDDVPSALRLRCGARWRARADAEPQRRPVSCSVGSELEKCLLLCSLFASPVPLRQRFSVSGAAATNETSGTRPKPAHLRWRVRCPVSMPDQNIRELLHESEGRFRLLADQSPFLIWVTNDEGGLEYVNSTYLEFFGLTLEDVQGLVWVSLLHPDDRDGCAREFFAAVQERRPFHYELRVRVASGERRWMDSHAIPRYTPGGEFIGMVGSSTDITERIRAETELREGQRYRELVATVNSAIIRWRRDGVVTFFNECAERLFGWRAEEIVGRSVNVLLPEPGRGTSVTLHWTDSTTLASDIPS